MSELCPLSDSSRARCASPHEIWYLHHPRLDLRHAVVGQQCGSTAICGNTPASAALSGDRTFASSCVSCVTPAEQSLTKEMSKPSFRAAMGGLGQTHLRRNAGHEQLLAARRVNGGADLWVGPRMRRRAIDRRDVGEDLADLFEDRVSQHATVGSHRREHGWHTEDL